MIEINRKLYMDESTEERNSSFYELKTKLKSIIKALLIDIYEAQSNATESS